MEQSLIGIIIESILAGGFLGWLVGAIVNLVMYPMVRINKNNIVNYAIKQGHVVKANLIKYYDDPRNSERKEAAYYADYEYFVDGIRYKRSYTFYRHPSPEITLYWKDNPKYAQTEDVLEQKSRKMHWYVIGGILFVFIWQMFIKIL